MPPFAQRDVRLEWWRSQAVVRKLFAPEAAAQHRAEAEWLLRSRRHPVVALVDVDVANRELRTALRSCTTLAASAPPPSAAVRLLSAVASTVAGLHNDRLCHGDLRLEHVIVTGRGIQLCSPSPSTSARRDLDGLAAMMETTASTWSNRPVEPGGHVLSLRLYELADAARSDPSMGAARLANLLLQIKPADYSGRGFRTRPRSASRSTVS